MMTYLFLMMCLKWEKLAFQIIKLVQFKNFLCLSSLKLQFCQYQIMKGQAINFCTPKNKLRKQPYLQDLSICQRNLKTLSYNGKFEVTPPNFDRNKHQKIDFCSPKVEDQRQLLKRLREAQNKVNKQKCTIKIMEETIHELDKLNQQLIQQSKTSALQLEQFTTKTNAEISEKNKIIDSLQMQLRKLQWKIKNMNNISSQCQTTLKDSARVSYLQQQLKRKNNLIQQLSKKLEEVQKEKTQKINYYDKVLDEKEEIILKMSEFNNELCMKLMLTRSQSTYIEPKKGEKSKTLKKKVLEIMKEKEYMSRKLEQHSEKITELETLNHQFTNLIRKISINNSRKRTRSDFENLSSAEQSQFELQQKISQIKTKGFQSRYDESHFTFPQSYRSASKKHQFTFAEEKTNKTEEATYDLFGQNQNRTKLFQLSDSLRSNCLKERIANQLLDSNDSLN